MIGNGIPLHHVDLVPSAATRQEREAPRPLRRRVPPSQPYPLEALMSLQGPARVLAEVIQAPLATCGQSLLAAAAHAVQAYRDVEIDGRTIPLSDNYVTVGESGERKSATDREALRAHRAYEQELDAHYREGRLSHENDLLAFAKAREEAVKKAKTRAEKKAALDALGSPPAPLLLPILFCEEPTYEGLVKLLQQGRPNLGLFSDEGGRMIGGHAMSEEQQLKTATGLSELWDGKRISRVRSGDDAVLLYGRRVSIHLMVQPQVALRLFNNALVTSQGFLSRCQIVWPSSTMGTRAYRSADLSKDPSLLAYGDRIGAILRTPLPLAPGTDNQLAPRPLPLSPAARELWIKFHDLVEEQLADEQPLASIRPLANKAPEHALRTAGILATYDDLAVRDIAPHYLGAAVTVQQYLLSEALRLQQVSSTAPDLDVAEKLLTWAQAREHVSLVDMYQRGLYAIGDAATARRLSKLLEEHGWFVPVQGGMVIDGQFRREVWRVMKV